MKPLIRLSVIKVFALFLCLAGCAQMIAPVEPIAVPEHLSEVGKEAQKLINEANILLAAAYDLVGEKRKDKLITKAEAFQHLNLLDDYSADVDQAQNALSKGDDVLAKTKAEATKLLIEALRRRVAEKARQ